MRYLYISFIRPHFGSFCMINQIMRIFRKDRKTTIQSTIVSTIASAVQSKYRKYNTNCISTMQSTKIQYKVCLAITSAIQGTSKEKLW